MDEPVQILTAEPALTVGREFTVTATLAVLEQPVCIGARYCIGSCAVGLAAGLTHVVQDNPADGDQL